MLRPFPDFTDADREAVRGRGRGAADRLVAEPERDRAFGTTPDAASGAPR